MRKVEEPSSVYQKAEEQLCECGAAGSGEGHSSFCPWLQSEWFKWGEAFAHASNVAELVDASKTVVAISDRNHVAWDRLKSALGAIDPEQARPPSRPAPAKVAG